MRGMAHADGLCELALLCTPACWNTGTMYICACMHACMQVVQMQAHAAGDPHGYGPPMHACRGLHVKNVATLLGTFKSIYLFWLNCIPCVCGVGKYAPTWRVMQEWGFESMQKHFENCMVTC